MAIYDLIKDEKTGKLSHTKIWSNIGLAAMTAVFIHRGFFGNIADMEMELLVYGIVVTAPNLLGKFLNMRFNKEQYQPSSDKSGDENVRY